MLLSLPYVRTLSFVWIIMIDNFIRRKIETVIVLAWQYFYGLEREYVLWLSVSMFALN